MSRRTGALARAFFARALRGWLLVLAGIILLGALTAPSSAVTRDYALCFGDEEGPVDKNSALYSKEASVDKDAADRRIAACTVIAEDTTEASRLRAKAFFYRASARNDKKDWEGAITDYGEAIARDPKQAAAYFNRGADWYNKGDDDRAIADFNVLISLDPSSSEAYSSRGAAFLRKGKIDAAIVDYQQAIAADAQNGAAHTGLGQAWDIKGDRDKASAEYNEAIRLDPTDMTALLNRALNRLDRGEFDQAIADYDAAIGIDPNSAEAYANRSAAWLSKNGWIRAIADASKAIQLDPSNVDGYYFRGLAWAGKGDNDRAIADFGKAIDLDADDARAWLARSLTRAMSGDAIGAAADCRKAVALDPRRTGGCKAGNAGAETTDANTAAKSTGNAPQPSATLDPSNPATWYIQEGLKAQLEGDVPGAIYFFSYAIKLDPDNAYAYYNRALAEASQGHVYLATSDCRRAVQLDPQRAGTCGARLPENQAVPAAGTQDQAAAKILIERAGARLAKYGLDGALLDFDKAVSLDPHNADAYLGRSRAKGLKGDATGAAEDCRRAIELDRTRAGSCDRQVAGDSVELASPPDEARADPLTDLSKPPSAIPEMTAAQGKALTERALAAKDPRALEAVLGGDAFLDMGKYDQAIGAYGKAIEFDSDDRFAHFGRGRAWAAKRDYGKAIADYDAAIRINPDFGAALSQRGLAKVTSGDADGALADCSRAAELDPKARDAFYCRGMAWHAKGDVGRAIADYSVAIGIDAKDDASYYARGMARAVRKDYASAVVDFDQALALDPGNPDYAIARKAAADAGGKPAADIARVGSDSAANGQSATSTAPAATRPAARLSATEDDSHVDPKLAKLIDDADPRVMVAVSKGDSLAHEGNYDEAINAYEEAIAIAPESPLAYLGRGKAFDAKNDYRSAIADFDKVIAMAPDMAAPLMRRGLAKAASGDAVGALADCVEAAKLDPEASGAYFCSGAAWYARGDLKRAVEAFSAAIEIDPKDAANHYARGMAQADGKNYAEAVSDFDQAAKLDSHNPNYAAARTAALAAQAKAAPPQTRLCRPRRSSGHSSIAAMPSTTRANMIVRSPSTTRRSHSIRKMSPPMSGGASRWSRRENMTRRSGIMTRSSNLIPIIQTFSSAVPSRGPKRMIRIAP